jgi:flagellar protein FlaG
MKATIAPALSIQDPGAFQAPPPADRHPAPPPPVASRQNADLRLIIEEDQATGTFVYKTLDRRTGEIVKQFPREQVMRLRETPGYEPGNVINAQT